MKGQAMQIPVTPQAGQTPAKKNEPNIVNRDDYKMHILKREYAPNEIEILIERWIPETGWTRTQILCNQEELNKIKDML